MEAKSEPRVAKDPSPSSEDLSSELSAAEVRAQLVFYIGLGVAILLVVGMIVLLVFLSMDAYRAAYEGGPPSPGAVVVSVLRDVAIVFVAFETLIVGALLTILLLQVQSLVVLLRDEIKPMLEAVNETLSTVRGTTEFVSHNVITPVMKWSGYFAGLRRILQQISGIRDSMDQGNE
jgi:hypothetical protein